MTYAKLQRKSDEKVFVHINTHLDHKRGQAKQAKVLLDIASQFADLPLIIPGDFNSGMS